MPYKEKVWWQGESSMYSIGNGIHSIHLLSHIPNLPGGRCKAAGSQRHSLASRQKFYAAELFCPGDSHNISISI